MTSDQTRRDFLRRAGLLAGGALAAGPLAAASASAASAAPSKGAPPRQADPWARANALRAKVRGPKFRKRYFDVTAYGAVGDGATDCTAAIRKAIETCAASGGGHVVVPEGVFLTGTIHLLSGVDLHVTPSAVLRFSQDPDAYLPAVYTRWEGVELFNYSPFIYAYDQENIGITGGGTLDGQADNTHWWPWKGKTEFGWKPGDPKQDDARARLIAAAEQGVPVEQREFGDGDYLRPQFVQPYRCRNVLIEDVTIINSPMWELHPVLCEDVLVRGVTIDSHGPNNDGCDPESCTRVVITGCTFDTGDDCIAIKAGRNADGRRVHTPTQGVLIEDCDFRDGHGAITIGSEMSGGVRDVFARDCRISSPHLDIALRFKTNSLRGGFIEDVYYRDLTIGVVAKSVLDMDFFYEEGPGYGFNPLVRRIEVRDVTVGSTSRALNLRGYADDPIRDVRLTNVDFGKVAKPDVVEYVNGLVLENVYENGVLVRR